MCGPQKSNYPLLTIQIKTMNNSNTIPSDNLSSKKSRMSVSSPRQFLLYPHRSLVILKKLHYYVTYHKDCLLESSI